MTDLLIPSRDLTIATQHWPGDGRPLLLIHGLGGTLSTWATVVPHLSATFRVIAMDLRSHGLSESGDWHWQAALDDVETVLQYYDAQDAFLVGHSLGGMVATLYATSHPDTPGIVNLDGFGLGKPHEYTRTEQGVVAEWFRRMNELMRAECSKLFSTEEIDVAVQACGPDADAIGFTREQYEIALWRRLQRRDDGLLEGKPTGIQCLEIMSKADELDIFDALRALSCPALLVSATNAGPEEPSQPWLRALAAARIEIVSRELDLLAKRPNVSVERVDATHNLIFEMPELVAGMVRRFAGA